ncbi:MAG: hypothetical protein AAF770_02825, partial [Bacteroidota bacterium]
MKTQVNFVPAIANNRPPPPRNTYRYLSVVHHFPSSSLAEEARNSVGLMLGDALGWEVGDRLG